MQLLSSSMQTFFFRVSRVENGAKNWFVYVLLLKEVRLTKFQSKGRNTYIGWKAIKQCGVRYGEIFVQSAQSSCKCSKITGIVSNPWAQIAVAELGSTWIWIWLSDMIRYYPFELAKANAWEHQAQACCMFLFWSAQAQKGTRRHHSNYVTR